MKADFYRTRHSDTSFREMQSIKTSIDQLAENNNGTNALGDLPLILLTSIEIERNDEMSELIGSAEKLSSNSEHIIVYGSDHFVPLRNPGIVVDSIVKVLKLSGVVKL